MNEPSFKSSNCGLTVAEWCPGNGTKYQVAATAFEGDFGICGASDDDRKFAMVLCAATAKCYILCRDTDKVLHHDYVGRKLGLAGDDLLYTTYLLGQVLKRPTTVLKEDVSENVNRGTWSSHLSGKRA